MLRDENVLDEVFGIKKPVIGMVHLKALPGAPRFSGNFEEVLKRAREDVLKLERAGFDGILIENFGDTPFYPEKVPPETTASMSILAREISRIVKIPFGVNVLRNASKDALAIACVTGADFVRINILCGTMLTDQGIISGKAFEVLRYRKNLRCKTKIFADILVKHASPPDNRKIEEVAKDTAYRGGAEALILTGERIGFEPSREDLIEVKKVVPDRPILIGSGLRVENLDLLRLADGCIVGTGIKEGLRAENPVDEERAREFARLVEELRR